MAQVHPQEMATVCFENFCEQTGWGAYSKFVIGLNVACLFIHGIASLAINLAIPSYFCEEVWNEFNLFYMCIWHLLGRAFAGAALCGCSDLYGRKRIMSVALICIFIGTFTVAFSHHLIMLVIGVAVLGAGLEGLCCSSRLHLTEILSTKNRAKYLLLTDLFWTFGFVLAASFAIFLRESPMRVHQGLDMKLSTWRMTFAISGGLCLIVACSTALLEESPRFLLHYGKHHLSMLILKQFYTINTSSYSENFKLREDELKGLIATYRLNYPEMNNVVDQTVIFLVRYGVAIKLMMSRRFMKTTIVLILLKIASILELFEINLILTKLLYKTEPIPLKGSSFFYYDVNVNSSNCTTEALSFQSDTMFLLLSINMIVGLIFTWIFIELLGRKILISWGFFLSGIGFTSFNFFVNIYWQIVFASMTIMFSIVFSVVVNLYTIESYPTAIRGTAYGFTNLFHIMGLLLFLVYVWHKYLFPIYGICLMSAALLSLILTETKNKPMVE